MFDLSLSRRSCTLLLASPAVALFTKSMFAGSTPSPWKDQGILELSRSPYAKLHSIPVRAVTIDEGFWADRRKVLIEQSIPTERAELIKHGRMENFRRLSGKSNAPQDGPVYGDAHIYKWLEAAGFALQSGENPELRKSVEAIIDDVVAAQEPSGYLNTYYVGDRASQRMLPATQTTGHEIYSIGHLLQAAIAYYRATGDDKLLNAGTHFFRDYVIKDYGPAPKKPLVSGHPGAELSLIELYRITGDKQYLDLAAYLLKGDPERISLPAPRYVYMFCGTPFTSRTKLEGHAVRAMYAVCGAADYYLETGDQEYWNTLETLWADLITSKMYVTGGVGARSSGESFGDPYELPNSRAYAESCASCGNMMWQWRMLAATGEARFTDVMERVLYNGLNSGISLEGTLYNYVNPLELVSESENVRHSWYTTNCCPSNLQRILAALPGYMYSTSKDGVYVHLFQNSELNWRLENGAGLQVSQKTNYPWEGNIELTVSPTQPSDFTLYLRIPGWSSKSRVTVNGKAVIGVKPGEYLPVRRRWNSGDKIRLHLDMTPQVLVSNAKVADDNGRVALQRGPIVYCLEQIDQPGVTSLSDVAVVLGANTGQAFHAEFRRDLLGGVVVLRHIGKAYESKSSTPLFQSLAHADQPRSRAISLTFIPYYAFANREHTQMQVWINHSGTAISG